MLATTLLCWRAMVQAAQIQHDRMRQAASHTASEIAAFAHPSARLAVARLRTEQQVARPKELNENIVVLRPRLRR